MRRMLNFWVVLLILQAVVTAGIAYLLTIPDVSGSQANILKHRMGAYWSTVEAGAIDLEAARVAIGSVESADNFDVIDLASAFSQEIVEQKHNFLRAVSNYLYFVAALSAGVSVGVLVTVRRLLKPQ